MSRRAVCMRAPMRRTCVAALFALGAASALSGAAAALPRRDELPLRGVPLLQPGAPPAPQAGPFAHDDAAAAAAAAADAASDATDDYLAVGGLPAPEPRREHASVAEALALGAGAAMRFFCDATFAFRPLGLLARFSRTLSRGAPQR
jgi:hypothetical protein